MPYSFIFRFIFRKLHRYVYVTSLTLRLLYLRRESSRYSLDSRLIWSQKRVGRRGEENNSCSSQKSNLGNPSPSESHYWGCDHYNSSHGVI